MAPGSLSEDYPGVRPAGRPGSWQGEPPAGRGEGREERGEPREGRRQGQEEIWDKLNRQQPSLLSSILCVLVLT